MGLPPTSSKISTDSNEVTTFKFDFPNFTGTHTGTDLSLGINSVAGGGTGLGTLTLNNVILGNGTSTPNFVAPSTSGNVLTSNGTTWMSSPASSGGTVTSVALADGSTTPIYSISGSPVTSSGTLTETLMNQNANLVFAGPASGSPAQPTFRTLTNADLPSGSSAFAQYISNQVTTVDSGVSSSTFTTTSNSPAFTFTPTISGTYKVYSPVSIQFDNGGIGDDGAQVRIFNTSGGGTLLAESQGVVGTGTSSVGEASNTAFAQSIYTLTAGTPYVFDIQTKVSNGIAFVDGRNGFGSGAPFYMFAEGIALFSPTNPTTAFCYLSANQAVTANNPIKFDTVLFDTNSAYSISTGLYTVPNTGYYSISSGSQLTGLAAGVYIQKNSTKLGYIDYASPTSFASGTAVVQANAGDTLQINVDSSVTCEGNATAPWITTFSIAQIK